MPRIRWKAQITSQDIQPLIQTAGTSIAAIQAAIQLQQAFVPYNAGGAQQAVTTVTWPPAMPIPYATYMQEHSEMVSLEASIAPPAPIWSIPAGGHVAAINGAAITGANYATNLPHCGYCTVLLWVLDLPLGAPTDGRYNLAVNLGYTVPADVANNVDVLSRLINSNAGGNAALIALKTMVNVFLQNPSDDWVLRIGTDFVSDTAVTAAAPVGKLVLDWPSEAAPHNVDVNVQYFGQNSLLTTLWKIVYQGIYDNVQ